MIASALRFLGVKSLISGVLVLLGIALLLVNTGNTPKRTTVETLLSSGTNARVVATGAAMQVTEYSDNGTPVYALQVQNWTQHQADKDHYVDFRAPIVELFGSDALRSWRVSAQRGRIAQNDSEPNLELMDNVQLRQAAGTANSLRLRSDRLTVNAADNTVTARGHVVLDSQPMQTTATQLIVHSNKILEFSGTEAQQVVSEIRLGAKRRENPVFNAADRGEDA